MRELIGMMTKRVMRYYDFLETVMYYLKRGYSLGLAIDIARRTF